MDLFLEINVSELNAKKDELSNERIKFIQTFKTPVTLRFRCLTQLNQLEEKILDTLGKNRDLDNDHIVSFGNIFLSSDSSLIVIEDQYAGRCQRTVIRG